MLLEVPSEAGAAFIEVSSSGQKSFAPGKSKGRGRDLQGEPGEARGRDAAAPRAGRGGARSHLLPYRVLGGDGEGGRDPKTPEGAGADLGNFPRRLGTPRGVLPARPPPPLTPLTLGPFPFLTTRPGPAGGAGPIEAQTVGNGPGGDPPTAASAPPCPPLGHRARRRAHKGRSPSG